MTSKDFSGLSNIEVVDKIGLICMKDYQESGVLASVSAAQMILESGYVKTELAINANNCFGMKCNLSGNLWEGSAWDGVSKYTKETKENKADGTVYVIRADFRKYPTIENSVKDHSAYLLGAKKGSELRYKGLKGERDYKKAIQIIKNGGYATDVNYVSKVCSIIQKFDLTRFDVLDIKNGGANMDIIESILTKNPCYTSGRKITVKGIMLHSVGCPQPSAQAFIKNWNSPSYNRACVHAFIDGTSGKVYQTLPWNHRGWHCGSGSKGSGNNTHIGVEMCEPACIKYISGSNFTCSDKQEAVAVAKRTYESAVQLFAFLCKQYNLNPKSDGVIISHKEGCTRGIASNHGDPDHLWKGLGLSYTMDGFRNDVANAMNGGTISSSVPVNTTPSTPSTPVSSSDVDVPDYEVKITATELNVRKGPGTSYSITTKVKKGQVFTIIAENNGWGKLKSGAGYISLSYTQKTGKVEESVTSKLPYTVKITATSLNVRKGPSTSYPVSTVVKQGQVFTITEEKDGWGKLKSGAGWISLKYTTKG